MFMYEKEFAHRLAQLRSQMNISARDMSLSLGQNPGYINTIENGKAFPTMANFFYICEFLKVTPQEFFDTASSDPYRLRSLMTRMKALSNEQIHAIETIVSGLLEKQDPQYSPKEHYCWTDR